MIGFARSYWLAMADAPFRQHLHGLTATAWFVLLILQPWLVTHGHGARHRVVGMFALLLAGAVIASGLAAIPYNLVNERLPEIARYGLSFGDVILVSGFTTSVVFGVINARSVEDHAHWMIATVFWALPPATFRLGMTLVLASGIENPGNVAPLVLIGAGLVNLPVLLFMTWRERRVHPAYLLAAAGSLTLAVALPVGAMAWWINIADAVFRL